MSFHYNLGGIEESKPQRNKYDPLPDYHLQNPLYSISETVSKHEKGLRTPARLHQSYSHLKKHCLEMREGVLVEFQFRATGWFQDMIDHQISSSMIRDTLNRLDLDSKFPNKINIKGWSAAIDLLAKHFPTELWSSMRGVQRVLLTMNALSSRRPPPPFFSELSKNVRFFKGDNGDGVYITGGYIGVTREGSSIMELHASDWLRMVSDVCTERYLVYAGSLIGSRLNPLHYPPPETIQRIICWGDNVLRAFGNIGFKLLKAYEALCLGVLQERGRASFIDPSRFLKNTLTDLWDEDPTLWTHAQMLLDLLKDLESPHHITQVFGLHRIWGHPLVNPGKGMEKMIIIGQKDIMYGESTPREAGIQFKKMLCKSYRLKNGVYPNVRRDENRLSELLTSNAEWNECDQLDLRGQWADLRFEKTFAVPESFNLSMIVADKSVSPTKSELRDNIFEKKSVMNQELRRGVLRWINHDSIDPREFLEIVNNGEFPDDHKIIGLRSKEREMNPTPRMFALMSHLMRVYVVITESMLSEHILPHFPQITMTDNQLDLTKKMYTNVRPQSQNIKGSRKLADQKTVCMSLDFEKWNGHMRKEATKQVFSALGELFGMPELYNQTYDIFKSSYFYLADGSYVPRISEDLEFIPEPPLSFTGHKGGQEGLRQKGWTIFTVACLDMICERHHCTYKIMGMGDNQVLLLTLYTNRVNESGKATDRGLREMNRSLFALFDDLIETFNSLGLPLKPLETWISEDLFVYGKYPIWQGVPLTMDLKKIMRIFPFSNLEIMTLENMMNTIAGNAQAAVQSSPSLGVSYLIGLLMMSMSIQDVFDYHPLLAKGLVSVLKESDEWTLKLNGLNPISTSIGTMKLGIDHLRALIMNVPRIIGGYVTLSLFSLLMRGFPDPLSLSLSMMYHWGVSVPDQDDATIEYLSRWVRPLYMPQRSMKLLIEDVSSVNLLAPVTPTAGLRQAVEKYLGDGRVIRNAEFRGLMTSRDPEIEEVLAAHLCSNDNLHIRLLHDIMEATIYGYIKSIISKVTKSATIVGLAVGKSDRDPLARVIKDEENYFRFFCWRSTIKPEYELPSCPTTLAKNIRKEGWGKNLIGVTVAFPWSYLTRTDCYDMGKRCTCTDGCISLYLPDEVSTPKEWNTSIGNCPPYLGSITKEKIVLSTGTKIYSGEPLIRRPINLMRVIGWFVPSESETAKVISACVNAVSNIDPQVFQGVVEGSSGSEIHRFRDTSLRHGALCSSNFLYSTRYHVSNDTFTRYAKGSQNYDMMFQANLCAIIESTHLYVTNQNKVGDSIKKVIHYKQSCYDCINPLDEQFYDTPAGRITSLIPSKKSNKYLYVPKEKVSLILEYRPLADWLPECMSSSEFESRRGDDNLLWLTDCVADNIASDIFGSASEETFMTTSLMDIKEHNRLFYLTLSPKKLYLQVCRRILTMAEWRCIHNSDWKIPTKEAVIRTAEAIIGDTSLTKWSGMSGFFSWPDSMKDYYFCPEIIEPDTIPVTTVSACKSIRESILSLLLSGRSFPPRQSFILPEDSKSSKIILKLILYDWLKSQTSCPECLKTVSFLSPYELFSKKPDSLICQKGHYVTQKMKPSSILRSRVTLDNLRKHCEKEQSDDSSVSKPERWRPLRFNSCTELFCARSLHAKKIPFRHSRFDKRVLIQPIPGVDLMKIVSLPTNAVYKYLEIFSSLIDLMEKSKSAFLVGNGLGGTSSALSHIWNGNIIISTLLDTGSSIPQMYPHANTSYRQAWVSKIDSELMVNRVNDILHLNWHTDWFEVMKENDVTMLVSDVEVNDMEAHVIRGEIINKLLSLNNWGLAIIKDYIYSSHELESRLALLLSFSDDIKLITCNTRQRVMPEVWWVIKSVKDKSKTVMGYHETVFMNIWESLTIGINEADPLRLEIVRDINKIVYSMENQSLMSSKVRTWASLPIAGCALPYNKNYTRLLGYLQRGKKPRDVQNQDNKGRKLYFSDYDQLRSVLFGLAVSMLASATDRENMLNRSQYWVLDWEPSDGFWRPYLKMLPTSYKPIHVYDYIPFLSNLMYKEGLLFKSCKDKISFLHTRNRKVLCFPITKTASLKADMNKRAPKIGNKKECMK
ncbi:RNA-dependent RNA polymerase [Alphacytorhabdovirus ribes]|nr:RNA-dependent RNA polymerase [Black currant cytorhabdovirus 1]